MLGLLADLSYYSFRKEKISAAKLKRGTMTIVFSNKLVAVMNEKIEPGVIMNALAHMCIGFGSTIGTEALRLTNYIDADGGSHSFHL